MAPWKLPFIVAGVVVPIAAAFMVGGPAVGVAIGALVTVVILAVAVRQRPEGPIGVSADAGERHVLIVASAGLDDPTDVARITSAARLGNGTEKAEVRVLVPARIGFLDRWASDVEGARHRAQQRLVVTVAALAKAGVAAEARVGDEDIVQAVEDQLQSYPATDVVLVSGGGDGEDEAAEKLAARLRAEFHRVRIG